MKCPQLLFVCWCSSILTVTSCIRVGGHSCMSAYWDTITCDINITDDTVEPSSNTYTLKFTDFRTKTEVSCPLVLMNHSYSCACKVKSGSGTFSAFSEYAIRLCNKSGCHSLMKSFKPSKNIQLTAPYDIDIQQSQEAVNITWKSGYENHEYLRELDYKLELVTFPNNAKNELTIKAIRSVRLHLQSCEKYCIKVRSKSLYSMNWSKWSSSTCWKSNAPEEQENILVILTKSLAPVCVVVGVLLFVFYSPAARMKIKTLSQTPSPASFFAPLFQQHEGDLQKWLSPKGEFALIYQNEFLPTDAVTIMKSTMKNSEENQDFLNPSVMKTAFIQCQTSYVELPGMREASPATTMVSPGDMTYTPLPCSVWGFDIEEAQAVSSPLCTKDFFEISSADSGFNCKGLSESPECSLPNSPVDDGSPPCYCNDYCILNKTAAGVVPVLVSKGNSLTVPSDSQHEDES
ncbi:interleukin-21 receptor-like [Mastacembelus armatus]|uniref:interleukin-21 receptor-like n=1 Tax=Mastacembelus armatus TaxID=205130 RepID=UPI000E45BE2A|nr:interleukin-21 receptor-like [Mastacembelus armatus]